MNEENLKMKIDKSYHLIEVIFVNSYFVGNVAFTKDVQNMFGMRNFYIFCFISHQQMYNFSQFKLKVFCHIYFWLILFLTNSIKNPSSLLLIPNDYDVPYVNIVQNLQSGYFKFADSIIVKKNYFFLIDLLHAWYLIR